MHTKTIFISITSKSRNAIRTPDSHNSREGHNQAKFSLVELHKQKDRFVQQTPSDQKSDKQI